MRYKIFRSIFVMMLMLGLAMTGAPQTVQAAGIWYVAPTGNDGNDCLGPSTPCATINGAIDKASAGDTINAVIGTYTSTGMEVVLINKDVTLFGGWDATFNTRSGVSTVDGQGSRRGITITGGVNTTIDAYLIQNSYDEFEAGGLLNQGTLALSNSSVNNNQGSFHSVAGILNQGGLELNNTEIIGNQGAIGGIENTGTLVLNNSTIRGNVTTYGGSVPVGGILNRSGGNIVISDSIINQNSGGGIYSYGTINLDNTTVSENSGNSSFGGVVNAGTAVINNSTINNNFIRGIVNLGGSTMTLNRSSISNNTTIGGGGAGIQNGPTAILNINYSFITGNTTGSDGGGMYNSGGSIAVDHSTISNNTAAAGSGILNSYQGTILILSSTISGNSAFDFGGGIQNDGTMEIDNVTINMNSAVNGGGGIFNNGGSITLNNSTISNNTSNSDGGGILSAGYYGLLILNNGTVSGNSATNRGGGVYNFYLNPSTTTLQNTIISGNGATDGPDCSGPINSTGYNLIRDVSSCTFAANSNDQTNMDPLLGPLQDNGGSTLTHTLLSGSPAIDAGNPAGCTDQDGNLLATDQRGVARPQGAACDIGAFELETANPNIEASIDIKPGSATNPINTKSRGTTPVAILSTADFDATTEVDQTSLTFGATGDEASLAFCDNEAQDVNGDGLFDLVCHFYTQQTGFQLGDSEGILKGQTMDGTALEGRDAVRILK